MTHHHPKNELILSHVTLASDTFAGSAVFYDTDQPTTEADRFNLRIAIYPKMIYFGLTGLCYELGVSIVYQCTPPLANANGELHVNLSVMGWDTDVNMDWQAVSKLTRRYSHRVLLSSEENGCIGLVESFM